jgi:hypothetical protein
MTEPDEEGFDSRAAAALIQATTEDTRRSLAVRVPQLYASWGVAWLIGLGVMWLSVRGQAPYRGPSAGSAILLGVLLLGAVAVTIFTIVRATSGIQGQSANQGTIFGLAWPIGFASLYLLEGALAHQGASGTVLGLFGAAGPLLVTSLIYLVGAAIWLDRAMFTMGAWLAVVAAVGVWTGPVTVLLVNAVAGGGGFLVMAGYLAWRARR